MKDEVIALEALPSSFILPPSSFNYMALPSRERMSEDVNGSALSET
jgi:hypothetical protein